jgi:hypothetical protein
VLHPRYSDLIIGDDVDLRALTGHLDLAAALRHDEHVLQHLGGQRRGSAM